MNTQLYNSLIQAHNFLVTVEKNEKDLIQRKESIKVSNVNNFVLTPKEMPKKFDWGLFFVLLLIGVGVLYPPYIYFHNRKAEKKQKRLDKLYNSPEVIRKRRENEKSVEIQKRELETKTAEYKRYYSDNYWKCLGFLPDWAREFKSIDIISYRIEYIDGLIHYVKNGAKTLDEAMERYGEELRELEEIKEERERQEMLERRHKEEIAALNTIAKNQERTNDELKRFYRDTFLRH